MITIKHKSFLLGKDNEPDGRQDALAVNGSLSMFAVADGVSNSFRPDIVAHALCDIFTRKAHGRFLQWKVFSEETLLPAIKQIWESEIQIYLELCLGDCYAMKLTIMRIGELALQLFVVFKLTQEVQNSHTP